MLQRRRVLFTALSVPLAIVVAIGVAWALDMRGARGEVVRNTSLAGIAVGGLERDELRRVVAAVDDRYRGATVEVVTPEGSFQLLGAEIDLRVDREATIAAAMGVGRTGAFTSRAAGWLGALADDREAPVAIAVDSWRLRHLVLERDPSLTKDPVEPSIRVVDGRLAAQRGKDGRGVNPDLVVEAIGEAATRGERPLVVEVEPGPVAPRFTFGTAERLAERAEAVTAAQLELRAGEIGASVPVDTLRGWMQAVPSADGLLLAVDPVESTEDLADLLPEAGVEPVDARFVIRNGRPVVIPGRTGTACCADSAAPLLLDAIVNRRAEPVALPLKAVDPDLTTDRAQSLGVEELVGEFTTNYPAGQARVQNIHRIADIVRGAVVEPGETFSVNGFVGRRTRDKGFVSAGVIYNGEFTEDVGGGVSQFATTLFNAVFRAGLEFEEYQSHSIYISRYPYGVEATLSYPKPDLIFRNNTPFGVVIWTGYTHDSVTVSLWSTKHLEAAQTGQRREPAGRCTRVVTERTVTHFDSGERDVDRVFAVYRPAEGVKC